MVSPTPRDRKLNAAHFAFMRGLVQGLPLREMWERYLQVEGSSSDLRIVRSTIAWWSCPRMSGHGLFAM